MKMTDPIQDLFKNLPAERLCKLLRFESEKLDWINNLQTTEWEQIAANAENFGLASVLYRRLNQISIADRIDPDILIGLKNAYRAAAVKGLLRKHELMDVVETLHQHQIPTILLKGCHLAEEIYRDPGLRSMVDQDILIPKVNLDQASAAMLEIGYRPYKAYSTEFETSISHQLPIFLKSGHFPIELHWTIVSPELPYSVDLTGIWERSRPLEIGKRQVLVLSKEDVVLHQVIHAASQHKLTGSLRLIYDLSATINTYHEELDWALLADRASRWRASSALCLLLSVCERTFGVSLPNGFQDAIRPKNYDQAWEESALELIFVDPKLHPGFSRNLAAFVTSSSLKDKILLGLHRVFPPPRKIAEVYPVLPDSPFRWLYYPRYLGYLTKRHISSIVKIASREETSLNEAKFAMLLQEREDYIQERLSG